MKTVSDRESQIANISGQQSNFATSPQNHNGRMQKVTGCQKKPNMNAFKQARKPRSYASPKLDLLTDTGKV